MTKLQRIYLILTLFGGVGTIVSKIEADFYATFFSLVCMLFAGLLFVFSEDGE